MPYHKISILVCLVLATSLLLIGCSEPNIGEIKGQVTINGKPLTTGAITFSNQEKGISVNANIGTDGTYQVKTYKANGLPPAEYKIAIKANPISEGDPMLVGHNPAPPRQSVFIPPRYQNSVTSGFVAVVKKGENEPFNFDLK